MPRAARVNDPTSHGSPLSAGPGSPDVRIGNSPAWRALPSGQVRAAAEAASQAVQSLMKNTSLTPASAAPLLAKAQVRMQQAAAAATAETNPAAAPTAASSLAALNAANATLTAAWSAASAVPGGMAPASTAYTQGLHAAVAAAAGAVMTAIAGSADVHTCPVPSPAPPHGPGVVTRGSATVRVNGLPAVREGDKVFEACGGADAIATGCVSVMVGG
ncbi:MAG: PAAR domain-containing protein [Phycisphaerae bacterium]|jgi:uncharacterized Zn-binding protein involved in type VI secretion